MGSKLSRRALLYAAAVAPGAMRAEPQSGQGSAHQRAEDAFHVRQDAALQEKQAAAVTQIANSDEVAFTNRIGNFSKGLPHNALGEVDSSAYSIFLQAMENGAQLSEVERIPMGSTDPALQMRLVNPCAGACFSLQGADSHHLAIPPAPGVQSAWTAGEMVELYWMALARDVAFTDYASSPVAHAASAELSALSTFHGPRAAGAVTPATLFRGFTAGEVRGPYLSQFLLKPVPFGAQYVEQRMRTVQPGRDFLTGYSDWSIAQNGVHPSQNDAFDPVRRYIRNGRDLGQWVHIDVLYQAYFNAMLIMLQPPDASDQVTGGGMGVPLNPGNPYLKSRNQIGFGTLGAPAIATAVTEIATSALKAVWYQKWLVHRRLRPEAYGGLVHNTRSGTRAYPLHSDVLNSHAAAAVKMLHGTYLLPMAFPEGAPLHPSYGAGHATVAGAAVTILKAVFDESYVIPNPVAPSADGLSLMPYTGPDAGSLTVGTELNKLASNIALGRNFAGVHWRSDYEESLKLGEALAISVLEDQKLTYREPFSGFTFTKFDGTKMTV
ncbi:MAG: phosphoesterase, PA-phosphatase related [Candidatus Solibacter sp.]|nr:phosphoesterase, PA-phosphatase related [Candidatus Solibacter sp.]